MTDFCSFRWHQISRHIYVVFGSWPGGAIFGRPGALVGAFAVSGMMYDLGMWGLGQGTEFRSVGGFFVLMGVGALEHGLKEVTGRRVGGLLGWVWTVDDRLGHFFVSIRGSISKTSANKTLDAREGIRRYG